MDDTVNDLKELADNLRQETWADDGARKGLISGLDIARRYLIARRRAATYLYHVTRSDVCSPREHDAVAVRCAGPERAREIVLTGAYLTGRGPGGLGAPYAGFTEDNIVVTRLVDEGDEGLIIRDFRVG